MKISHISINYLMNNIGFAIRILLNKMFKIKYSKPLVYYILKMEKNTVLDWKKNIENQRKQIVLSVVL